jgi:hypothetical protein
LFENHLSRVYIYPTLTQLLQVQKSENPLALVGTMYLLPWLARLTTKHLKSIKQLREYWVQSKIVPQESYTKNNVKSLVFWAEQSNKLKLSLAKTNWNQPVKTRQNLLSGIDSISTHLQDFVCYTKLQY